jgi:hypothetical protein
MIPNQRVHRRQFIQDSIGILGAGSVAANTPLAPIPRAAGDPYSVSDAVQWQLQGTFDSGQRVWILTRPEASFRNSSRPVS